MKFRMGGDENSEQTPGPVPNTEPGVANSTPTPSGFPGAEISHTSIQGTGPGVGGAATQSRSFPTRSASGIFDVSRMNVITQEPVETSMPNASAGAVIKHAKANTALIRGLLIAITLPLLAGGGYLLTSGSEAEMAVPVVAKPKTIRALAEPVPQFATEPATHAALPKPITNDVAPTPAAEGVPVQPLESEAATVATVATVATIQPTATIQPAPLKLVFNHKGELVSPFSFQLDENGNEVSRFEPDQVRPYLPMGTFEEARSIGAVHLPAGFTAIGPSRPYTLTEAERKRVLKLRESAIEVRSAVQSAERIALSRLQKNPVAAKSFSDTENAAEAQTELRWLRAASFTRDVSGNRSIEKRLLETLKLWAKTYQRTGSAIADLPLLDALYAYDLVRHLWSTTDQIEIDSFFKDLVEAQFSNIKLEKNYSLEHAAHVRFATSVGFVTGNAQMQFYGQLQFRNHVQNSALGTLDSFGNEEVAILGHLLQAAFVLERSNSNLYQQPKLNRAVDILVTASQTTRMKLLETMAIAAYFRQDLYRILPATALATGISGSRFGTHEGTLLAAIRKPTTFLGLPMGHERAPSSVPVKLPPKRVGK